MCTIDSVSNSTTLFETRGSRGTAQFLRQDQGCGSNYTKLSPQKKVRRADIPNVEAEHVFRW